MKKISLAIFLTLIFSPFVQLYAQCSCTPTGAPVPAMLTSSNVPTSASLSITGLVTINGAVSLAHKRINIGPAGQIYVPMGQVLIIDGSWLYGCGCLWKGIKVDKGGSLTILNSSVIEDAKVAVHADMGATSSISVTQSLFNKNTTAIYLSGATLTTVNNVLIDGNIFTCRAGLTSGFPHLNGNLAAFALVKQKFLNNYNTISSYYPTTTTAAGVRSKVGVGVIDFKPGLQTKITNSVFDYLDYGVYAMLSDLGCYGNQFSNMPGNGLPEPVEPGYSAINGSGIGIRADGRLFTNSIDVSPTGSGLGNTFYNLFRGVDVLEYLHVKVDGNTFQNQTTDDFANFNTAGAWYGQCGVQVSMGSAGNDPNNPVYPSVAITNNHILWFATGVHIMRESYNTAGITVSCNQIGDSAPAPSNTQYIWQGIFLEDMANGLGQAAMNGITITYNNVCRALQNCIIATGVKNGLYIRGNGTTNTQYNASVTGELSLQYMLGFIHSWDMNTAAIAVINCQNGSIRCNEVRGTGYKAVPGDYPHSTQFGILCDASPFMKVIDNNVTHLNIGHSFTNGIAFRNNCYTATLLNNAVRYSYFSFSLDNSTIGQQGSSSSPIVLKFQLDQWNTAVDYYLPASSADPNYYSQLYLFSNMIPYSNFGTVTSACPYFGKQYEYASSCPSLGLNNAGSTGTFIFCANTPVPNSPCGAIPQLISFDTLRIGQLDTALFDSSAINIFAGTRIFQTRRYIWQQMYSNNMYSSASSFARSFYDAQSDSAIGRFARVESALSSNDLVTAQNENTFVPANNLQLLQQQVNNIRIKIADTIQVLSGSDTASLLTIANGCPEVDGVAVYEARTLLNILYGQPLVYVSNCADSNFYRLADRNKAEKRRQSSTLSVYPNPNSGSFEGIISDLGSEQFTVELHNSLGEVIMKKTHVLDGKGRFTIDNISAGVYVMVISVNGRIMQQKVVVTE